VWRAVTTLCAGLLTAAPVAAQTYELRTYQAAPDRLDELHARFRAESLPLLNKHGAEVVGAWVPKPNPDNAVVVLLSYPSVAGREAVWSRIVADPQWANLKARDDRGLLVQRIAELPLSATLPPRAAAGDLELRTHDKPEPVPGAIAAFVPARPRPGVAAVSLHPRRPETAPRPHALFVTLLLADPADAGPKVTVLSPTDYSPRR
jgi:hypothetical protein